MQEILTAIGPYITTLLIAIIGALIAFFNARKANIERDQLKEEVKSLKEFIQSSTDTEYYSVCPYCGNEIILNKLEIFARKKGENENVDN